MAINANVLRRPSDSKLLLAVAALFPLIVLVGYSKTYYFKAFFTDVPALANNIVHLHAFIMSAWVVYFVVQVALIRTKNVKLHMTMGMAGIALAVLVIAVGLATGYNSQIVRHAAPPGANPREFFIIPITDMVLFAILFAGAIYYRKRPAQHKSLMILTAVNFMPAAISRLPFIPPELSILAAFGIANGLGLVFLLWHSWIHKKFNWIFAAGLTMLVVSLPLRIMIAKTDLWHGFTAWLAS